MSDEEVTPGKVMSAAELLGFSDEAQEPVEIELKPGQTIKARPLDLEESMKLTDGMSTDTPEGMSTYIAAMIAETIVEPELTEDQRSILREQIKRWPTTVVSRITNQFYEKMGISDGAIGAAVASSEAFLAGEQ